MEIPRWALPAANVAGIGRVVTDNKGRTLYRFDKDRVRTTNCSGACKKAWPPVTFTTWRKLRVQGVDRRLVNFIVRKDDGKCQLTINGRPMYYFAMDDRPEDTEGQGVRNDWWLVSPKGGRILFPQGGSPGNGGYGYG